MTYLGNKKYQGIAFMLCMIASCSSLARYRVLDGDTIEIDGNKVRLLCIDAPEKKQKCVDEKGIEYECGVLAKEYLKKMIASEGDPYCACDAKPDRYGRDLCFCYTENGPVEYSLNERMVSAGLAVSYMCKNEFHESERIARLNKVGMWRGEFEKPCAYRGKKCAK